jgi:uncharacterized oligopeptide transporter (OPT) family protein
LPWPTIGVGAAIGAAIIAVDEVLKAKGAGFRVPVLAAAVGIYLPLELSTPIFLGGLLAWFCDRTIKAKGVTTREEIERLGRKGMLFAAGVITGEALTGIVIAIPIVVAGRPDVLALPAAYRIGQTAAGEWLGLAVLGLLAYWLYRTATSVDSAGPSGTATRNR